MPCSASDGAVAPLTGALTEVAADPSPTPVGVVELTCPGEAGAVATPVELTPVGAVDPVDAEPVVVVPAAVVPAEFATVEPVGPAGGVACTCDAETPWLGALEVCVPLGLLGAPAFVEVCPVGGADAWVETGQPSAQPGPAADVP